MNRKKMLSVLVSAAVAVGVLAGAAWAQGSWTSPHTFYDLETDNNLQNNSQFNAYSDMFHKPGGDLTVVTHGSKKALAITNRSASWHGLDIKASGLKINGNFVTGKYTVHVAGIIPSGQTTAGVAMKLGMCEYPYSDLAIDELSSGAESFELKYEFKKTAQDMPSFVDLENSGEHPCGYFRIQTREDNNMSFTITKLIVKVEAADVYQWPTPAWNNSLESIKDKFKDAFKIGNIMSPGSLLNNLEDTYGSAAFFKKHYNTVTLENAMKPTNLWENGNGQPDFSGAESVVKWANDNNIDVIGHTLAWHSQSAKWLNIGSDGKPLTRAKAKENLKKYIDAVAGHYAGKVTTWDVVNEAFMHTGECFAVKNDWKDAVRSSKCHRDSLKLDANEHTNSNLSPWYDAYDNGADKSAGESGADYLYDAFVFARLADPNATLYYNDYNEEYKNKRNAIARMTEDLNAKWAEDTRNADKGRLLIEGLGMQSHYYGGPNPPYNDLSYNIEWTEATIKRWAETGARVSITELDIPMGSYQNKFTNDTLTHAEAAAQGKHYADLMRVCLKYRNYIDRVTFWGMSDGTSWRAHGMPLLFDNSLRAKAAYDSIMAINIASIPAVVLDINTSVRGGVKASAVKTNPLVSVRGRTLFVRSASDEKVSVKLINVKGKTVKKFNLKGGADVSLRKLPAGAYIVEARRGKAGVKDSARVVLK